MGFEPTRGDPIGLAGRRLNRSAKVSFSQLEKLTARALYWLRLKQFAPFSSSMWMRSLDETGAPTRMVNLPLSESVLGRGFSLRLNDKLGIAWPTSFLIFLRLQSRFRNYDERHCLRLAALLRVGDARRGGGIATLWSNRTGPSSHTTNRRRIRAESGCGQIRSQGGSNSRP